jgi:hypothetical protein
MDIFRDLQGPVPYPVIFPEADEGVVGLRLPRKVGKAKAGDYDFVEAYCVEKKCDCRRVTIIVFNDKRKAAAVIEFGFDPEHPLAGPCLHDGEQQSAAAEDLLQIFTEAINENPAWLAGMYQRYRQVRKKVDGRAYRGKPFAEPGTVPRKITRPIEDELETLLGLLSGSVRPPSPGRGKKAAKTRQLGLFGEAAEPGGGMAGLVEGYRRSMREAGFGGGSDLQTALRRYLLEQDSAGEELAMLLGQLFSLPEKEQELFEAALRALADALDMLRIDLERQRPGAKQRMERWQQALARHIFNADAEDELCAAVTHTLLQTRIEILPQLHAASSQRILARGDGDRSLRGLSAEEVQAGLFRAFEELGLDSPFELLDAFLQMLAVGDAEVQVALCGTMLTAANPLIRDAAVLMLCHPQAEVRQGVALKLGQIDGPQLTPESLRRLIVGRNWFPERLRGPLDQAIASARKGRVECAPLPQRTSLTVHSSVVDGAGAQSFQVIVPEGRGFVSCSILLKQGVGVADAFLIPLDSKKALRDFLAMLSREAGGVESSAAYLDQRLCQALAEGARLGNVPSHWLLAIAERLGRDQWRAVPCDPRRELAALRAELETQNPKLLSKQARQEALEASADWPNSEAFAASWFEDDACVDREVEAALRKNKKRVDPWGILGAVVEKILKARRELWLERLVLSTHWLKSAKKPPVPWVQMFHVAEALADAKTPLQNIPLMLAIAEASIGAHMARVVERR